MTADSGQGTRGGAHAEHAAHFPDAGGVEAQRLVEHRRAVEHLVHVLQREGIQPAAEPRYLQRHNHVRHVPRALLPVPCPQSAVELSPARRVIPRARALAPRVPWPLRACPGPLPSVVHARLRHRHSTPSRLPARTSPPALYALSTRQNTTSVSAANKLLIRCAWAGTSAFASAGYGSSWGPGSCSPN